ncbi:hypothetical protein BH09BAC1_BH09BAC1_02140 [soil metagenome]
MWPTFTLSISQVNYLNIVLMVASAAFAFWVPFELFMFSYVVLGPLHYLTEMAWLHKRNYFVGGGRAWWLLVGCGIGLVAFYLADFLLPYILPATDENFVGLSSLFRNWVLNFILLAVIISMVLVAVKDRWWRLLVICVFTALLIVLNPYREILIALGILIPTIVHTCLFMLAFIILGALKSNSFSGYLSIMVFLLCSVSFFFTQWGIEAYDINPRVLQNLQEGFFLSVNDILGNLSGHRFNSIQETLYSPLGIRIQQFIAFSYTYHYLNWFSKTNVINWHQMPRQWAVAIALLWVGFVLLYWIDFKTGLLSIFLLSMLHVFLEFPLNYRSILGIGTHMYSFWKPSSGKP